MKILIAGGSGYIGRRLSASLLEDGHEVVILSRSDRLRSTSTRVRFVTWDARTAAAPWSSELNGADGIVNLAGVSIGAGRWTRRRMENILGSRLQATSAIVE